jgi:alpha-ribazole phosphatase/probable phosphoglycerate mutase
MTVEIIYETHSTTVDNETGIATGWLPGTLSAAGRDQARSLGKRRRDDGIHTIFVSDLARAVETAEIAFSGSDIPIIQDARLRECNYGKWNGMPVARLAAERSQHIDQPWPGGQSYRDVVIQTEDFLRDLAAGWDGKKVLLIAHSANRWALQHLLHGSRLEDLVDAPFAWQEGWRYVLPADWRFWLIADELIASHPVVIDRPAGSRHPRFPEFVYPLDYGYLDGTTAADGGGIDIWRGSQPEAAVTGVIVTIDLQKRDAEIKLLIGCTQQEAEAALATHQAGSQVALLVPRPR